MTQMVLLPEVDPEDDDGGDDLARLRGLRLGQGYTVLGRCLRNFPDPVW